MAEIKQLLTKLISFASITPNDLGCQDFIVEFFTALGFTCYRFTNPPVANFFARLGSGEPLLIFAGHTDVVPIGTAAEWLTPPFKLTEKNGIFYGRGAADMKGSLASMMLAAQQFSRNYQKFKGSLGFLLTSGEEGDHFALGTPYVMEQLQALGIKPKFCVIGEPSSEESLGDVIKIGRRGSLTGTLTMRGKQGHVAYPHLANNPIHMLAPILTELLGITWDEGNKYFPPTTLQITHINAGGQANNIIPGELKLSVNFRFSPLQTVATLTNTFLQCFKQYSLFPELTWQLNGEPFLTAQGELLTKCIESVQKITGVLPKLSTSGGTSDGRFIAPYGVEVIELGPVNATIHQVNECVARADLEQLTAIYYVLCELLLGEQQ